VRRSLGSIVLLALLVLAVLLSKLVTLEVVQECKRMVVKELLLRRMQLSQVSKLLKSEVDL
jgi:hypothetical protein